MFGPKPGWGFKLRFWIERDGRKVLGHGRVELLQLIDRHRSISAAAKQMAMSYRRAWSLVQDINEAAGEPYVERTTGGTGGGGAELTPRGKQAVRQYQRIVSSLLRNATKLTSAKARA